MKGFRVKAIGLGLALATGSGVVASDWGAPVGSAKFEGPTVWLPARERPAVAPPVTPASGGSKPPLVVAPVVPIAQQAQSEPIGSRTQGGSGIPQVPAIPVPVPPTVTVSPAPVDAPPILPALPQTLPMARPSPLPLDTPAQPKSQPMMPPPRRSGTDSAPLPQPRSVNPEPTDSHLVPRSMPNELPCAPTDMIYSPDALGLDPRTVFGSPPIQLSRDYPPLRELISRNRLHNDITLAPDGSNGSTIASPTDAGFNRYFVSGEYLLWWMPGYPVPVLATSNANTALNGYFGEPGTTSILGPGSFIGSTRSGFRVRAGAWLDDAATCGIDGSFFFLGSLSSTSVVGANNFPLITRPVYVPNPLPGNGKPLGENGEYVSLPGALRGTLTASGDSFLWGADVNLRKALCTPCGTRAEVFAGYRYLNLRESLTVTENITVIGTSPRLAVADPIGTQVIVQDRFRTLNSFNGGQIGALYGRQFGRFDVTARGSVALGGTHQSLDIAGYQVRQQPGLPAMSYRGGLLAAGPNLGHFTRDRFSVVPEFTLNFGYRVTPSLRVFAGYNFLLWTNVIRPGDQIDRVVDVTFVPNAPPAPFSGQARPHPLFAQRDLVVQGIQFGVDYRW